MITKKQTIIVLVLLLISSVINILSPNQNTSHTNLRDIFVVFAISVFLSLFLPVIFNTKLSQNIPFNLVDSYVNLLYFIGYIMIAISIIPFFIACFEGNKNCLDLFAGIASGLGLILGAYIKTKIAYLHTTTITI